MLPAGLSNMAVMLNISQKALLSLWRLCFGLLSYRITFELDQQTKHKRRHKSYCCGAAYVKTSVFYTVHCKKKEKKKAWVTAYFFMFCFHGASFFAYILK